MIRIFKSVFIISFIILLTFFCLPSCKGRGGSSLDTAINAAGSNEQLEAAVGAFAGFFMILGQVFDDEFSSVYAPPGNANDDFDVQADLTGSGNTNSHSSGSSADYDTEVISIKSNGTVNWQKKYGTSGFNDWSNSIQHTENPGFILAGRTNSGGGVNTDIWVLKLNESGAISWQKRYDNNGGNDEAFSVLEVSAGSYIVAGVTDPNNDFLREIWVLKLKSDGTIDWQKSYGTAGDDVAYEIQKTSDGGYIVAGYSDHDIDGKYDVWIIKLKNDGSVDWEKRYGTAGDDRAESISQTSDGGYIVAGYTDPDLDSKYEFWILKLKGDGTLDWQKTYGGSENDLPREVRQTTEGGYIVIGYTGSFGAGSLDMWIIKLTSTGTVSWQRSYGGSSVDVGSSIREVSGGFVAVGGTKSFGIGGIDSWLVIVNKNGKTNTSNTGVTETATLATASEATGSVTNTSAAISNTTASVNDTNATESDANFTVSLKQ
ncbi:MAG: hypothetical protein HY606_12485 [Planctomycetes bacterium]|nr:hypothetical protein [Planctomycetota bacterium]